MAEKVKTGQSKSAPKDAQVIISIMKDMGISEYEPKVINQLLEFTYRYVHTILEDSKVYANHAKKKTIDVDDVQLAAKMQMEKSFTNPPPREVLMDVAKVKNVEPLPPVKPSYGLRLPPDRYCLNGTNYKLHSAPSKKGVKGGKLNSAGYKVVKRPGSTVNLPKTQTISMAKPTPKVQPASSVKTQKPTKVKPMEMDILSPDLGQSSLSVGADVESSLKRKREDDSDGNYDMS
ncbi:hypothetical protein TKK_0004974 [Trichogramma kaykai]|uniref:Transcription initiation factor TFIID subunit 9 n=1 Tax=Trichogramma kaykai TaxID=54128 RepID=A0ABD2XIC9_9HYME